MGQHHTHKLSGCSVVALFKNYLLAENNIGHSRGGRVASWMPDSGCFTELRKAIDHGLLFRALASVFQPKARTAEMMAWSLRAAHEGRVRGCVVRFFQIAPLCMFYTRF